ncbi:hypothetical protein LS73_004305 [Helicobacter muridarum]|uniref:Uncharacterized protein n=1 Tax=Helicobacter muridarum TaxID=216 RepID=A0A099TYV9_9HELI|nr:hypothetical protein [Helicobacter muridarum]TLE00637.1 hypothetical protein LS73_004305 [Helicobacter muridarum]STQ85655.1 Uncharacterised protein [Helicobacter muridarum]
MALNSIGNLTYINQASSATSAIQANNMPHPTTLNHSIFHEQMQKIEEVRPTEQSHKLEDKEGNGKREFENEKEKKGQGDDSQSFEKAISLDDRSHTSVGHIEERVVTEDTMLMKLDSHLLDIKG